MQKFLKKNLYLATSGHRNSAMMTYCQKFTSKISLYEISSFISTIGLNLKSFPWRVHSVQETFPNFLRRPMRVDNTADNADRRRQPFTIIYWVTWH